ncbi:response regulator transcription factor [Cohnella silvisoli]|uniref:Response regulator transcription factor n=1 Tax=Cohnella silvisoli TaxID=2873699 RepID=A0ABV1KZS8_9BACL|nr:response regulator transcription factor [Cohnella silvisoli]MCD9025029.1 response regulator transcription factor [Cohnella silvisoli]
MKVVIIDDERAMHLIMKRMLAKVDEIEIVGSFQETATAYSYLVNHEVDLVFVDISMPREDGMEFAQRLRESGIQTKLVFITSHKEYALYAFDVYAFDYIVKPVAKERLHQTIQRALAEIRSERSVQSKLEFAPAVEPVLTEQEKRILLLISDGLSNKEIAQYLNITGETVKSHIKNMYRKLEVNNRVQALQRAKQLEVLA